jgi:hypothetical protein
MIVQVTMASTLLQVPVTIGAFFFAAFLLMVSL